MPDQLRIYSIKAGEMDEWTAEWRAKIAPLREKAGFQILGAWTVEAENKFVWIIRYAGPKAWKEAEAAYYNSPERAAMDPNPARHIEKQETLMMDPLPGDGEKARWPKPSA